MNRSYLCFAVLCLLPVAVRASIVYNVNLSTAPLVGDSSGPFSLAFQLADGSGTGDGNNAALLTNFQFGGGGPLGSPTLIGSAFGDLASTVVLTDSAFPNYFAESFTPGAAVSFLLTLSTNVDGGGIPDEFSFYVLDNTGTPIPTTAGSFSDVFVQINIDSSNPSVTTFASDTTRSPAAGGQPIDLGTATVQAIVPEPSDLLSLSTFILGLLAYRKMNPSKIHLKLSDQPNRARQRVG